MINIEIAIIGGGPAGLCAAIAAASMGAEVMLLERSNKTGGQLIKQTHKFFGSEKQYASVRGIDISDILISELQKYKDKIKVLVDATVMGVYEDGIITVEYKKKYIKIKPQKIIVATGASEKFLAFPNNDLPGIYGAGAVQTLMNEYGVAPGKNVLMVGAGNIGLIVSYQLLQAGVKVRAIIDAAPKIGGFLVHAAKIRRMGIPILTSHTVKYAHGCDSLEKITICELDDKWQQIPGSEKDFEADVMCIAVGLSPLCEVLWQIGCEMKYVPELSGHVPVRNSEMLTSVENIYIAGDAAGVEEASSAMVEGRLAGLCAAKSLGYKIEEFEAAMREAINQLTSLRSGPVGARTLRGLEKVLIREEALC